MALKTIHKSLFGNIWSLSLLVLFLSVVGPTALFAQTPLKVGIAHNPPIAFLDEKGMPQGVFVDTLNAIAQKENWALEYVFSQWAELLEKAKKGDIDLVAGIAKSPERDTFLDFTREAFAERWGVVYAPEGPGSKKIDSDRHVGQGSREVDAGDHPRGDRNPERHLV